MVKKMSLVAALGLLVLSCGDEPREPDRQVLFGAAGAKADLPGTCRESCGAQASEGCWCDDMCVAYGDCCPDRAKVCDAQGPQPCSGVCVYGAHCSDYCPQGASCIKVVQPTESYWWILGCHW